MTCASSDAAQHCSASNKYNTSPTFDKCMHRLHRRTKVGNLTAIIHGKAVKSAYKPGSVINSHSSRHRVTTVLKQPTRIQREPRHRIPIWSCSRWGLPCRSVTELAVRSYRTISPLPNPRKGILAVSFCCTFRRLTPPRCYLAPCPMEPGLSSASSRMTRLSSRLHRRRLSHST